MIKRIIFDIDMTLLDTLKDTHDTYIEYFKDEKLVSDFYNTIEEYDSLDRSYEKEDIVKYINEKFDKSFTVDNFNKIFKVYQKHGTLIDDNIPSYLEKLSKRYELVALSKWYVEDQEKRLECAGILKYFKKVYGIENAGIKPDKKAFLNACENYAPCECLMVGDSIRSDMEPTSSLGIYNLYLGESNIYTSIKNIGEIEDNIRYIIFNKELNYIKDEKLRNSAKKLLSRLPDYFFEVAASSSGKYHPLCDLGPQGLIRHSKNVVRIGYELLNLEMYSEEYSDREKDLIIYSLLFHDGLKHGLNGSPYTIFEHPLVIGDYIKTNYKELDLSEEDMNYIYECVVSHMGQWNTNRKGDIAMPKPKLKHQKFVHMCDYIVSRNFMNIEYDKNDNIIEERGE